MSLAMSPNFDSKKAYLEQESGGKYFDDGREVELLHFIYGKADIAQIRGNPQRVLDAIDEYGRTKKYLMNVGEFKGKYVTDLIAAGNPQTMVSAQLTRKSTRQLTTLRLGRVRGLCWLFCDPLRRGDAQSRW